MKKSIFTIICMAVAGFSAFAQAPTITSANMYNVNEVALQYGADTTGIVSGPAGANVTWDFTGLQPIPNDSGFSKYVFPGSTLYGSDFPTADLATQSAGGTAFAYFTYKNNTVTMIGEEGVQNYMGTNIIVKQIYDKPETVFSWPITYNTNQNSMFHAYYVVQGDTVYRNGTQKVVGDAYGTLKIMNKTFTNVLRVHANTAQYDSVSGFPFSIPTISESWSYMTPGKKDAILTIFIYSQSGQGSKSVTFNINDKTASIDNPTLSETDINIYPNPAQNNCSLTFSSQKEQDATLTITNQLGQQINLKNIRTEAGKNKIPIDITGLSKGFYMVTLQSANGIATQRLIIE